MSAEDLGKRLLAEVEEERLDEVFDTIRTLYDPTSLHRLGVPPIDRLLALTTGLQHPRHVESSNANRDHGENIHETLPIKRLPPPFIEITSSGPGDGKQHLLYHITTVAVLPSHIHSIPIRGNNNAIIVLDTENRFSIPRLVQIMRSYISNRLVDAKRTSEPSTTFPSLADIESTITSSLQHMHIFRPQSMASLLVTVSSLPAHLFDPAAHHSSNRAIHAIILTSASAFFWSDKSSTDLASLPTSSGPSDNPSNPTARSSSSYTTLATSLKTVSKALHTPVIYTTWDLSSLATTTSTNTTSSTIIPDQTRPREPRKARSNNHLPNPWQTSLPSLTLSISRRPIRKFPTAASAEEADRDRRDRYSAVGEGRFDVVVQGLRQNGGGGGGGGGEDGECNRERGFEIRILDEGVEVIGD